MDIPKRFFELFSGNTRVRAAPTLVIAAVVTALVAVPLTLRAVDARDDAEPVDPAVPAELVLVDAGDIEPSPLDGSTVAGPILVSVSHPSASGVAFNLFPSGEEDPVYASQDLDGPVFDLIAGDRGGGVPLDSTLLSDGEYELFLTVATPAGEQRTAVRFMIRNS